MKSKKVRDENTRLVEDLIATVRKRQPILKNPEGLTDDIMNAIRENSVKNNFDKTKNSGEFPVIIILQRLLAAASVCLFLLFGYEEYVVVDKISRLEKQNAAISQSSQYQSALNLKKAISIFCLDPEMQSQYKELKTKKIDLRTLLRAAIYVDAAGLSPYALELPGRFDNKVVNPIFMSILKQFDSTNNNIRR
jgi:hypothetical protein